MTSFALYSIVSPTTPVKQKGLPQKRQSLASNSCGSLSFPVPQPGEGQNGFEQVPVHRQGKRPVLELGEAPGDGEAQAAPLGIPGGVAADKALHDFTAEMFSGSAEMFRKMMVTCSSVAWQVRYTRVPGWAYFWMLLKRFSNTRQSRRPSAEMRGVPSAGVRQRVSCLGGQALLIFPGGLAQEDVHIRGLEVHGQVACGGFGGFH